MKIKSKIALRYSFITAILMLFFATTIYLVSAHDREKEFYDDLQKEGVSKANLFFEAKASPETMHSIYRNNIEYIDEVEVAIYTTDFKLLYHDAKDIDIVKETQDLIDKINSEKKNIKFYVGEYQAVGFIFLYNDTRYIITAAAYDGYGYTKLHKLVINLSFLFIISVLLSFVLGYLLAKRALEPVSRISDEMKNITANNLHLRLANYNEKDEFGELANSFNRSLDIIEESFISQKMFVSNVSHELRTPLAILIGEIDLALMKDRTTGEYITALENSKYDVTRLIKLVNGLLDLARASYDESKISKSDVRIDETLLDARDNVLKANKGYNINIEFINEIGDDSELTIRGNEYLLRIAFINLMENNCKFSKNKSSSVRIFSGKDKISITFSDTGIGIPIEDIKEITTPFYRGQNKDFASGNGIGLALVNKIVYLHKGILEIESEINKGTSVKIQFPTL